MLDYREHLFTVLQYDSYGEKKLTDFDRMFIQQDISNYMNNKPSVLPEKTKVKILEIIRIINQLNWESPC